MKTLYLVRGVSGSGKTSFVSSITHDNDVVVANDDFMVNEKGEYEFDWRRLDEVTLMSHATVENAMQGGTGRIFVHNTFTTEEEVNPFISLAKQYDYRVFSIIVENRHGGESQQKTPETTREKQRKRFSIQL